MVNGTCQILDYFLDRKTRQTNKQTKFLPQNNCYYIIIYWLTREWRFVQSNKNGKQISVKNKTNHGTKKIKHGPWPMIGY